VYIYLQTSTGISWQGRPLIIQSERVWSTVSYARKANIIRCPSSEGRPSKQIKHSGRNVGWGCVREQGAEEDIWS